MNASLLNRVKRDAPAHVFTIILIALLSAIMYGARGYTLSPSAFSAEIRSLSGFTYEIVGGGSGEVSLPHTFTGLPPRTAVTLYTEIDAGARESLFVKTNFAPLRLYVDDKLVYECGQEGSYPAFFIDPPTIITTVPLPDADGIQRLRFEYLFPKQRDLQLPTVLIGDEVALVANEYRQSGFSFLFSIILIFVGVVMMAISLIIMPGNTAGSAFLWLGLFAAATGVWVLGECDLAAFLIPNPSLLYVMAYTGLFTTAIPFLQYGQLVLQPRSKLPLRIMMAVLCAAVAITLALQLAGVVSLARSLFVFHVLVPLSFVLFAACLLWEYVRYKNPRARRFAVPVLVMSLSTVLEVINYQFRFIDMLTFFFQFGILFFVIAMGFIAGRFASEAMQTASDKLRLEIEVTSMSRVLDLQREQYGRITQNVEQTKAARHDMRHQLAAIGQLTGDDKVKSYVAELLGALPEASEHMYCENYAVNAVVTHYLAGAFKEGISADVRLDIPEKAGCVSEIDLCIIMGNLLENAVEACRRAEEGERFIRARSGVEGVYLSMVVENSFDGRWKDRDGVYLSRKVDDGDEREGVGLSSVKAVCAKYNGLFKVEVTGGIWRSSALVDMGDY